jgi:hypothetical protein
MWFYINISIEFAAGLLQDETQLNVPSVILLAEVRHTLLRSLADEDSATQLFVNARCGVFCLNRGCEPEEQ